MKRIFFSLLVCGMFANAIAQTTFQPDQYEPNNTITQARNLNTPPMIFEPSGVPPGIKRVFQANFHDATDESDWYLMTFTNLNIHNQLPVYWGNQTQEAHLLCYPYLETVEVALSGMASNAVYNLSINNATSNITSNPTLPISLSGSKNVSLTVQFATNNCGTIESLLIGVRRMEGNTVNEGYTLTFSYYRNMPGLSTITSISPTSGPAGTMITITGNNLGLGPIIFSSTGLSPGSYCYYRVPAPATPLTSITATVPSCAITGPVFATTSFGGGRGANSQIFTVTNDKVNPFKRDSLPQKSSEPSGSKTDKWVITPVANMKGVLGKLDINFPPDVERNILIYQSTDNKFITSVSRNDKIYTIAPGQYRFTLTNVPVENVPIQKGHETRIKMGFLNVVSEGGFYLYNETKEKLYTTYDKPKKIALPVGNYQLKLGGQFYPFTIKDKETVEY
jgi:hypothetical protein